MDTKKKVKTDGTMKEEILKAWNKGARSFDEVVKITGYKESQVAYYLPRAGRF